MKKSLAFTLAEVLITLAIIGVVAAMTVPSVIVNTNQQEFKTGLRKAISVLNSAITMNIALEGETPYDNADLFRYLQQHMSILRSTTDMYWKSKFGTETYQNFAFYTTDGIRFEVPNPQDSGTGVTGIEKNIHESANVVKFNDPTKNVTAGVKDDNGVTLAAPNRIGKCGSNTFKSDDVDTTNNPPCLILVDVNGDRRPTPSLKNIDTTKTASNGGPQLDYVYPAVSDKLLKDIFPVIITEEKAIPYGVVAQRAMYQTSDKRGNNASAPATGG